MSGPLITPRTLQGFRDYPPALMMPRERLLETARRVYRSYGFAPIDTPALEYAEILCGKGGDETDKQMYRFLHGKHDVALRFDLTIPFARFAAMHVGELGTPFKRYAMGPVWRGERPQAGRYREFWQCDFDTIGTTSNAADIEVALVIHDLMTALEVGDFQIRVNNRLVLNGLLEEFGIAAHSTGVLRCLDKLGKVNADEVATEMVQKAGITSDQARQVLALASLEGSNADILNRLSQDFGTNAKAAEGIGKLRELLAATRTAGIREDAIRLDLSIARGLDYYTGTIYETFLLGSHPTADGEKPRASYGSVCSGGRYDNLAGLYTKQTLPGVGASLGLDRLLGILEASKVLPKVSTPAPVLIVQFLGERVGDYQRLARVLRAVGIGAEVYPDPVKIGKQLQYASDRGFRVAVVAGSAEFERGEWKVKNLASREEKAVPESGIVEAVRAALL